MSDTLLCNRCTLQEIQRNAKKRRERVELQPEPKDWAPKGVRVLRNGQKSIWFAELSETCEC